MPSVQRGVTVDEPSQADLLSDKISLFGSGGEPAIPVASQ